MERFESTKTLMRLLESGKYKRRIMENDDPEELDFEKVFENYKDFSSRPNNYEYFERCQ